MPTGYTGPVRDGEITSANEFLRRIARNFGAFIHQRDEDMDAPLRVREVEESYHVRSLREAKEELAEIRSMTNEQIEAKIEQETNERFSRLEKASERSKKSKARYDAMVHKVEQWTPPTPDHEGVKTYALEQLRESMRHDCYTDEQLDRCYPIPERYPTPAEWLEQATTRAEENVVYHATEAAKTDNRENNARAWGEVFLASLPND